MRAYLGVIALGDLVWESAQLPLYTIWRTGTVAEKIFAVVHCTGGDLVIAATCFVLALIWAGDRLWPTRSFGRVAVLTLGFGDGYVVFSEWLNIVVRKTWAYSDLMPVLPITHTGMSPLLQWIVVPAVALWSARIAAFAR